MRSKELRGACDGQESRALHHARGREGWGAWAEGDSSLFSPHSSRAPAPGFTLIELIIVMAILALLISIAVPRYFAHIERAKEATLKQDLNVMRDAIDKFYGDKGRYPDALEELVNQRYIRNLPLDPITESQTTWTVVPPPAGSDAKGNVYDVKSGAAGTAADGSAFSDW